MQALVFEKIKDPSIKRRNSISIFREEIKKEPEKDDQISLTSMFKPNTDFYSYVTNKEENRYQKLEWKAQFKKIDDIV